MKRPPAAHRRYLSPPAAATSRGKAQVFVLRLPPQHKPHATFMQPPHCILQHDVANPHVSTHMATPDDNNPTAITRVHCYCMWCQVSHHNLTPPFIECIVVWCQVSHHSLTPPFIECIVMWCQVSHHGLTPRSHTTLHLVYSYVMSSLTPQSDVKSHAALHLVYCYVMPSLTPPFIECIVMWCQVSHHPSLSALLCDAESHTTLHWVYCYVMSSLTPPFIEFIVMWCQVSHHPSLSALLCDAKSHTTLHWVYSYVM